MPQHTLVLFRLDFARLIEIGRRRKNTGIVEPASDLHNTNTLGTPLEYLPNRRSCFFVDNKMMLVIGVFAIPMLTVKFLFSVKLTDEKNPMRVCEYCGKAFYAYRADSRYCSADCRNKAGKKP